MRVGYLTSRYPQVSHTFIQREVAALRATGVEVETFAVRRTQPGEVLSASDREELARTTALLPVAPLHLAAVHARALLRAPSAYTATLADAIRRARPGLRGHLWALFYFAEAMLLRAAADRRGIRHLHVHFANVAADVAMLATAYARRRGAAATWSFTMHGPTELYDVERYDLRAKAADADRVVCISSFARSQMMGLLAEADWDKLLVVHCGVDLDAFRPASTTVADAGPVRVLCVGRLVPVKGQALLVRAVSTLRAGGADVRLVLVGEGESRAALEALVARERLGEAVELVGAVGQDEIRDRLEQADVFCLPSFAEGVPVVLMEAMAMGKPVLTTRIAGVPELVEDGVDGVLVAPGDLEALTAALAGLVADPPRRVALGRAGRATVAAHFDVRAGAGVLRDLFAELSGAG